MFRKFRLPVVAAHAVLAAVLALSVPASGSAAAAKSDAKSSAIEITMNGEEFKPNAAPFVKNGTVFLPLRDLGEMLGSVVFWNGSAKTVTMTYPELTVQLNYGTQKATVNGKTKSLSESPRVVEGRIYVPLRFLSETTGADVKWNASKRTVSIKHSNAFVKGAGVNCVIWLNRNTGDLYIAHPYEQKPVRAGKVEGKFEEFLSIHPYIADSGDMVVTILDNYGEPHVQYAAYGVLVHGNKIVAQKKAKYFQRYEENAVAYQVHDPKSNKSEERLLLTDGKTLSVYDTQGKEVHKYDLPALGGKDETYAVLGAGEDYLVVRPNQTGLLTLINLDDKTTVNLAEKILKGDDLEYALNNDVPYHGDELKYLGQESAGGLLVIGYDSPFDKEGVKTYTYNRKTGEVALTAD
ncbi:MULTISPECIES: copper amine oxidase N-terminal domain-containing protein [Paenibacillus]|uniref:copper amine oxidase N-terminal domain-containing protein n=1 Tax=Paenibacillus TaxID=44249 RepID=UPI002FE0ACBE